MDQGIAVGEKTRSHDNRSVRILLTQLSILAAAMLWTSAAWAAQPEPLTTLHTIHALTKDEARQGLPVAFDATVTYYNPSDVDLFVQDGGEAIYVETKRNEDLEPGDRVLVRGQTRNSFNTDVLSSAVVVIRHGAPPLPVAADFEQLIRAQRDCMWVSVRATVRSADIVNYGGIHSIYLKLMMAGGIVDATVIGADGSRLEGLLDDLVEVHGVVSGKFDNKMQLVGILLEVPALADVRILKRASVKPHAIPVTSMNQVLSSSYVNDLTRRVRVRGSITYYHPGYVVVLQNGSMSLWISTHSSSPLRIGDIADVTGFPNASEGFLTLSDGEIRDTNIFEPVHPQSANWDQLSSWNSGSPDGHQSDLVDFQGKVVAEVREDSQDEFVVDSDGKLFTAIYRHPAGSSTLPAMPRIPVGTRIRVTGICAAMEANDIGPTEQEVPFDILLRSFEDISIVARPSLLNVRNLVLLAGFLLLLVIAASLRAWLMERKVRHEHAVVADIEIRRSRILEDINGSRPLAEIIEQISELLSVRLQGAPSWYQIADGAQLGRCPENLTAFRVIEEPIRARSGRIVGTISAAFDLRSKPRAAESETLTRAAALATLAIETRRLYTDLVHRSDFDLLTDIHNRFSLESYLGQLIETVCENAGIFGLIYIDLDHFKEVNDTYGHQIGDLYLREVAARVKQLIRPDDMLARLGGDEFAVLLPDLRNRDEAEEVAHRIERCIEAPFATEGYIVHGSASIGVALYPEDGTTQTSLLSAADAVMYVNKHVRQNCRQNPADRLTKH